ncbi:MAG: tRNA (adenine-N1)-methyltransferase [Candidatus Hydrothermarchaeales archaeon]
MKVLIDKRGIKHVIEGDTLHTNKGVVDLKEVKHGDLVETHLGHEFRVVDPRIIDLYEKMPRAGSFMLKKDIGLILAYTGLGDGDVVVDSGTGSAGLVIFLGNIVKPNGKIYTYEKNEEAAKIAERNIENAGLGEYVKVRIKDISEGINEKADVITLDMEGAWKAVPCAKDALRIGGFMAVYNPYIEHATKVVLALRKAGFKEIKTVECIEREMEFRKQGVRPKTRMIGHTGYLTFARKL